MALPKSIENMTVKQFLTYVTAIGFFATPIAGAGVWGLNHLIKAAVAEEKFVTQEALDAQTRVLEEQKRQFDLFKEQLHEIDKQTGILQTDIGTLKAFSRDNTEYFEKILKRLEN